MKGLIIIFLLFGTICQAQTNIVKSEYWIDTDPGFDNGIVISGFTSQPDVNLSFVVPANLTPGVHTIGIRSKNLAGQWSHTNFYPVCISDSSTGEIVKIEYFWDTDPGFGIGIDSVLSSPAADITNGLFIDSVPMSFLLSSTHVLFERSMDSRGRWSHTNYVDSLAVTGTVSTQELETLSGIKVFPNPFNKTITLHSGMPENMRVIIYDSQGRKVIDIIVNEETIVNTESLAKGVYTVFVVSDLQKLYKGNLIKQ